MNYTRIIEVIDSTFTSGGLGLTVLAAARAAQAGMDMPTILHQIKASLSEIHMFGIFNTLKYLAKGGRIHKTFALAGNILHVKPLLTFSKGEIVRSGTARTFSQGLQRINAYLTSRKAITEMMIVYSNSQEDGQELRQTALAYLDTEKI